MKVFVVQKDLDSHTLAETILRHNIEVGTLHSKLQQVSLDADKHQNEVY